MGLSGRKVKQRIPADPRNLSWANDASKFGTAYLQKFGWDSSAGLGPQGEGRTKHISVYQKLDMLGIGADHKNNQDGTAWKQGRDFENLLRRLNEGAGKDDGEVETIKIDGFTRPASNMQSAEQDLDMPAKVDEDTAKPHKSKKRKHDNEGHTEGRKKEKKKRRKSETVEDSSSDTTSERRKEKQKASSQEVSLAKDESPLALERKSAPDGSVVAKSSIVIPNVPRPLRAHRARHIASKGLASKNATAISEILGVASSSSTILTPAPSAYPSTTNDTPTSASATPSSELKLQDITTSTKSVMDYFREKLAAKSNIASYTTATISANNSSAPEPDDYDERPRGLGASRLRVETTYHVDYEDRPRYGLGASGSRVAVESLTTTSTALEVRAQDPVQDEERESSDAERKKRKKEKKLKRKEMAEAHSMPSVTDVEVKSKKKAKKREREVGEDQSIGTSEMALAVSASPNAARDAEGDCIKKSKKSKEVREKRERKEKRP